MENLIGGNGLTFIPSRETTNKQTNGLWNGTVTVTVVIVATSAAAMRGELPP